MCSSIEAWVSSRTFAGGVLLALLSACAPDHAPPPTPASDPTPVWQMRLRQVVDHNGDVDLDALRADHAVLDEYIGWIAEHGPESDAYRNSDDNRRLAFHLNALNALTLWLALDGVSGAPYTSIRARIDGDIVPLDRHILHTVIATYEDARALAGLYCREPGCPPMRASLYEKKTLDLALSEQMVRWVGNGLVRVDAGALVFTRRLEPWLDDFRRWNNAPTPCAIAEPYADDTLLAALRADPACAVRWE